MRLGVADCVVVGAGPAGLTAALYMARYRRDVVVLHDGTARALRIPLTHNAPGFPDGISGPDLVDKMTRHANRYGAKIQTARVISATRQEDAFELTADTGERWRGRTLILATGIQLNQIPLDHAQHEEAIRANVLRYCPICDAFEHIDKKIGVIGCDVQGGNEAMFLRRYSRNVTLLPRTFSELSRQELSELNTAGIKIVESPVRSYSVRAEGMHVQLASGDTLHFDVVYPALGVTPRTELAKALGIVTDDNGCVDAGSPFETQVPGLYSAGDIVEGLDQISVAISHGAIAATKAHNWLRQRDTDILSTETQK